MRCSAAPMSVDDGCRPGIGPHIGHPRYMPTPAQAWRWLTWYAWTRPALCLLLRYRNWQFRRAIRRLLARLARTAPRRL
jgi:hypothetical protein